MLLIVANGLGFVWVQIKQRKEHNGSFDKFIYFDGICSSKI